MSSSSPAGSRAIPIKKVTISSYSDMPSEYSSTPGGTMFSTTPGGSRIVYEKAFMMNLRNSPCSKTPPSYDIPERVLKSSSNIKKNGFKKSDTTNSYLNNPKDKNHSKGSEEDQFQLEL